MSISAVLWSVHVVIKVACEVEEEGVGALGRGDPDLVDDLEPAVPKHMAIPARAAELIQLVGVRDREDNLGSPYGAGNGVLQDIHDLFFGQRDGQTRVVEPNPIAFSRSPGSS